ncbi:hypothetical protein Aduo_015960 [Ancylostoma duodenale]
MVILPATFPGSPRYMIALYQDSMAIIARTPEEVDIIIWAHIPDPRLEQLHDVVTRFNLHGRCGHLNPDAPCMDISMGRCSKLFPKPYCDATRMDVDGFPEYARPCQGFTHTTSNGEVVGNKWVVPYNWYLSSKYEAHINVELCSTISAIKYLNKYVYKGPDRAGLIMQSRPDTDSIEYDEIRSYLDTRYSCPPQAAWNIFGFALHDRSHSVVRLPVQLPGQQEIFFQEEHRADAVNAAAQRNTQLTEWFRLNQVNQDARRFLYREIPEHFSTFREAAIAAGYLQDDEEYRRCLEDARRMSMPSQMRASFAYILSLCETNNGHSLWNDFKNSMMEDFLRGGLLPNGAEAVAFTEIKEIALGCGVDITTIIPPPMCTTAVIDNDVVDVDAYREEGSQLYQTSNAQQKHIVDAVITNTEKCVFIDGPGGSGKTYIYNVLYKLLVGQGKRLLNVAWSGIAATLLPRGRTVHSAFCLPIPINETRKTSLMSVQSRQAKDLHSTDCIIWDKAPMAPKFALEEVTSFFEISHSSISRSVVKQ